MALDPRYEIRYVNFVASLAAVAPVQRTVVILSGAWEDPDEPEGFGIRLEIHPVVFFETAYVHCFHLRRLKGSQWPEPDEPTVEGWVKAGWRYRDSTVERTPVFVNPEWPDLISLTEYSEDSFVHPKVRFVTCDWPSREDESRLAPHVEEMKQAAIFVKKRRREEEARKPSSPKPGN